MPKKQKIETWEDVVRDFKPTIRKEDFAIVLEQCQKLGIDFHKEYKAVFTIKESVRMDDKDIIHVKCDLQPKTPFNARSDKIEFDVEPSVFGYSKRCEMLVITREEGVLNFKTRRAETGLFIFKCNMKTNAENLWLFFSNGKVYYADMKTRDMITQEVSGLDEIREFSDFDKRFKDRVLISAYDAEQLRKKGLIKNIVDLKEGILSTKIVRM